MNTHPYWRLFSYLRPYGRFIALTWIISLCVLALQALTAWIGAGFIERILQGRSGSPGLLAGAGNIALSLSRAADALLTRSSPFRSLATALAILVGTGVLTMCLRVWKIALFARINQSILHRIRVEMFDHLIRLDLAFSRQRRPGEISSLFTRDVDGLRGAVVDICDRLFMQPLRLLMALLMLWSLSPGMALVFMASLIVCGLAAPLAGRRIHRLSQLLMGRIASLQGFLTEYLTTVILARALGRETVERKRFDDLCDQLAAADIEISIAEGFAPQLINNLFMAAGALILLFGSFKVLVSHTMDSGVLLRFALCLPLAAYPVESLALLYVSSRRATASAGRVFALLNEPPAAADRPGALRPPAAFSRIEFKAVGFQPGSRQVLQGVSFQILAGQRLLISGPSGAGKTSVLNLLAGVIRPDSGSVTVDGLDLANLQGEAWRQKIGVVPQEPLMMNGTIRENLRFASEFATEDQMIRVLKQALFEPDTERCYLALDRQVGNRGELLSGGERQRLAIARALLKDPILLLMDEPVAHLDAANRLRVRETVLALPRSVTIVFASHDSTLHGLADIEVALRNGRCVPPPEHEDT
jgi:ATP-binding cassette, subfamily B, bacterial